MQTEYHVDISRWVYREKIKMLFDNFRQSWPLSLLVGGLLCYLSVEAGAVLTGVIWWLLFAFLILLRLGLVIRFHRAQIELHEYEIWQQKFFIITLLTGIAWGAGAILISAEMDAAGQVFILMILIGVSGGAIPMLGVLQRVMLAFQLPMVIPYVLWIAPDFENRGLLLMLVTGLYLVTVMFAMKRLEKSVTTSLTMRYRLEQRTEQLLDANEKLEHLTLEDSLTGIYNRRYFERELEKAWRIARRDQNKLALLMIDIDNFKNYNDTYGHAAGDECLRQVARLIQQVLHRPGDIVARIGGEEFVTLLPGIDEEGAMRVAQLIQAALQEKKLVHASSPVSQYVTVSIGIALTTPDEDVTSLGLFQAADKALYKAKAQGRNLI
ncbi:MAG TPA: diguanylate cyclase, partial [Gammaproteobacteria bacterium]|nr:diguanylate cyclase [Gammaproteobacteria bacterium]